MRPSADMPATACRKDIFALSNMKHTNVLHKLAPQKRYQIYITFYNTPGTCDKSVVAEQVADVLNQQAAVFGLPESVQKLCLLDYR